MEDEIIANAIKNCELKWVLEDVVMAEHISDFLSGYDDIPIFYVVSVEGKIDNITKGMLTFAIDQRNDDYFVQSLRTSYDPPEMSSDVNLYT